MQHILLLLLIVPATVLGDQDEYVARIPRFTRLSAEQKTRFILFNHKYPDGQMIIPDFDSIKDSSFDPSVPTRFLIHGFTSSGKSRGMTAIRQAYMQKGFFNIIIVDWGKLSETKSTAFFTYNKVASSIRHVGEQVGKLAVLLNEATGAKFQDMYLIGHSLGAHIAGFAGQFLQQGRPGSKFGAIFGLDPAGPYFNKVENKDRLSPDDAVYVETIQTDSFHGKLKNLGHSRNIGHVSFFPNYGRMQPGCSKLACSHQRAWNYFAESITSPEGFYGVSCPSLDAVKNENCPKSPNLYKMGGEPAQTDRQGIFFVPTNKVAPFAKGQYGFN